MAYARRGYRRSAVRRRSRPSTFWYRQATSAGSLSPSQTQIGYVDLLYGLKSPPTAAAALLEDEPQARTIAGAELVPPKDPTGSLVKRIRCRVSAMCTVQPQAHDGFYAGIIVMPGLSSHTSINEPGMLTNPKAALGAVTEDWLWWERVSMWEFASSSSDATGAFSFLVRTYHIDTRCVRKLEDWGDTLALVLAPAMTSAVGLNFNVSSSVLLSHA